MNREEILAKSREENKNKDMYEQEVLKQASRIAIIVQVILATIFYVTQIFVGGGANLGLWSLVLSVIMTFNWVKYIKLHRNHVLVMAIVYTILVVIMSGNYIYDLIASSTIL